MKFVFLLVRDSTPRRLSDTLTSFCGVVSVGFYWVCKYPGSSRLSPSLWSCTSGLLLCTLCFRVESSDRLKDFLESFTTHTCPFCPVSLDSGPRPILENRFETVPLHWTDLSTIKGLGLSMEGLSTPFH